MKRIRLNSVTPPWNASAYSKHKVYRVDLGNRRHVLFPSHREAKAFQVATEQFLEGVMHEVNALLADAHHAYRMAWPAFGGTHAAGVSQAEMREALLRADELLDRAAEGRGPNRMHFAWKHLDMANDSVLRVFDLLQRWYRYKTQGIWRHQALIALRRCKDVNSRLRDYGLPGMPGPVSPV